MFLICLIKSKINIKVYPCPFVSERVRKPVYGEIGNTIMSLLCDTRNFQYTIPQIDGLIICMEVERRRTRIVIPECQYDLVVKSLLTSNDYVFSMASLQFDDHDNGQEDIGGCDAHLVAVENENLGSYSSKTIMSCTENKSKCKREFLLL